jgi:hypothetical protein
MLTGVSLEFSSEAKTASSPTCALEPTRSLKNQGVFFQLGAADDFDDSICKPESILFKHNQLYRHNMIHINYMTDDIRRAQDMINPKTSHCNIMVLKDGAHFEDNRDPDWFRYAQVLGIYHANVIYVEPGMLDYEPC